MNLRSRTRSLDAAAQDEGSDADGPLVPISVKASNIGEELHKFFFQPESRDQLRAMLCGPLQEELVQLRRSMEQKDALITVLSSRITALEQRIEQRTEPNEMASATADPTLQQSLDEKDDKIAELQQKVQGTEECCDALEQYSRRNSLRLVGVPETQKEDIYSKTLTTLNESLELDPPLTIRDVDRLHRSGKRRDDGKPRQILIKFVSYQDRSRVFSKKAKLSGSDLHLNEDLTRKREHLLWLARMAKKARKIDDCWTSDGRVLLRNLDDQVMQVKRALDIPQ